MDAVMTREQWLDSAVEQFRERVELACEARLGAVKVSVGFPSKRATSAKNKAVGQCWHHELVKQDAAHVFISPLVADPVIVLGIGLHELCHAALPAKTGHKAAFAMAIKSLGLEGKPTSTVVGAELADRLNDEALPVLGPYPHQAFDVSTLAKKQSTRLRLYECQCPVKVRVARDDFDATCNWCDSKFVQG